MKTCKISKLWGSLRCAVKDFLHSSLFKNCFGSNLTYREEKPVNLIDYLFYNRIQLTFHLDLSVNCVILFTWKFLCLMHISFTSWYKINFEKSFVYFYSSELFISAFCSAYFSYFPKTENKATAYAFTFTIYLSVMISGSQEEDRWKNYRCWRTHRSNWNHCRGYPKKCEYKCLEALFLASLLFNNKLTSVTDQCNTTRNRGNRWRYQQVSHYNPNYCKSFARIQLFLWKICWISNFSLIALVFRKIKSL